MGEVCVSSCLVCGRHLLECVFAVSVFCVCFVLWSCHNTHTHTHTPYPNLCCLCRVFREQKRVARAIMSSQEEAFWRLYRPPVSSTSHFNKQCQTTSFWHLSHPLSHVSSPLSPSLSSPLLLSSPYFLLPPLSLSLPLPLPLSPSLPAWREQCAGLSSDPLLY